MKRRPKSVEVLSVPETIGLLNTELVLLFKKNTIWITPEFEGEGFIALDHEGHIVARNRYRSTLEFIVRREVRPDVWAVAQVINPSRRQPNRAIAKRGRRWP